MTLPTLLVDSDGAADDAAALLLAVPAGTAAPAVALGAVTAVAGSVDVDTALRNLRHVLALAGAAGVPVHRGAAASRARGHRDGGGFHGRDGLGDALALPPVPSPSPGSAVAAIVAAAEAASDAAPLVLVTLGPLTNLALACEQAPLLLRRVRRCVVMGGAADGVGNVTPAAEYNFWADPEAAAMVMASGLPLELVGWELSRGAALLDEADQRSLQGTPRGEFVLQAMRAAREAQRRATGAPDLALPDAVAMGVALDPTLGLRWRACVAEVECGDAQRLGALRLREARAGARAAVRVCTAIDTARWKRRLLRALVP